MKITIADNKPVSFEEIAEGTIFVDPTYNLFHIRPASLAVYDVNPEGWNSLRLDNYIFAYFSPRYDVYPIYNAELIIR